MKSWKLLQHIRYMVLYSLFVQVLIGLLHANVCCGVQVPFHAFTNYNIHDTASSDLQFVVDCSVSDCCIMIN